MGGVAGHMDHLYDNSDLTFSKMKEIMEAASNAELKTEEKVDGQNLFLSYSSVPSVFSMAMDKRSGTCLSLMPITFAIVFKVY